MTTNYVQAALGDLRIHVRTDHWGEPVAEVLAPVPGLASNWAPVVHLEFHEPVELRAFAAALVQLADEREARA